MSCFTVVVVSVFVLCVQSQMLPDDVPDFPPANEFPDVPPFEGPPSETPHLDIPSFQNPPSDSPSLEHPSLDTSLNQQPPPPPPISSETPNSGSCSDKAPWCATIEHHHCYGAHKTCCATCQKFIVDAAGEDCRYGDKAPWCSTVQKYNCYKAKEICCAGCKKHQTGDPSCEYGDVWTDCAERSKTEGYCERDEVKKHCCSSCKRAR